MIAASWDIRHVDLSDKRPEVAANDRPLFVMFWWRGLPLGVRTYLPEQLPLQGSELAGLTAELASAQLARPLTDGRWYRLPSMPFKPAVMCWSNSMIWRRHRRCPHMI